MPVQNFSHFGIIVTGPERSMRFYCDMLGFKRVSKMQSSPNGPFHFKCDYFR